MITTPNLGPPIPINIPVHKQKTSTAVWIIAICLLDVHVEKKT